MHERSCPHVVKHMSSCYYACVLMDARSCPHVVKHMSSCYYACVLMDARSCPHVVKHMSSCYYTHVSSWTQDHVHMLLSICPHVITRMCPHVGIGTMIKIVATLLTPATRMLLVVLANIHTVKFVCPTSIGWIKLLAREASGYIAPRQQRRITKRV